VETYPSTGKRNHSRKKHKREGLSEVGKDVRGGVEEKILKRGEEERKRKGVAREANYAGEMNILKGTTHRSCAEERKRKKHRNQASKVMKGRFLLTRLGNKRPAAKPDN